MKFAVGSKLRERERERERSMKGTASSFRNKICPNTIYLNDFKKFNLDMNNE